MMLNVRYVGPYSNWYERGKTQRSSYQYTGSNEIYNIFSGSGDETQSYKGYEIMRNATAEAGKSLVSCSTKFQFDDRDIYFHPWGRG